LDLNILCMNWFHNVSSSSIFRKESKSGDPLL
jgi:hypothetical protein